jgi:hypothetical protein
MSYATLLHGTPAQVVDALEHWLLDTSGDAHSTVAALAIHVAGLRMALTNAFMRIDRLEKPAGPWQAHPMEGWMRMEAT